jgi:hypothetical protein
LQTFHSLRSENKILKIKILVKRRFVSAAFAVSVRQQKNAARRPPAPLERFDGLFLFPQNVIDSENAKKLPVNSTGDDAKPANRGLSEPD